MKKAFVLFLFSIKGLNTLGGTGFAPVASDAKLTDIASINQQNTAVLDHSGNQVDKLVSMLCFRDFFGTASLDTFQATYYAYNSQAFDTDRVYAVYAPNSNGLVEQNSMAKTHYSIDLKGLVAEEVDQTWSYLQADWVNAEKYIFTYNSHGDITMYSRWVWDTIANNWGLLGQTLCNYDAQNQLLGYTAQRFIQSQWHTYLTVQYTYDGAGNILTHAIQALDSNNRFGNFKKDIMTYDADNHLTCKTQQYGTNGAQGWANVHRQLHTYVNGLLAYELGQNWDADSLSWANSTASTYAYNNGNPTSKLYQIWNGQTNNWQNSQLTATSYIGSVVSQMQNENWDTLAAEWTVGNLLRNGYNSDGQLLADTSYDVPDGKHDLALQWINEYTYNDDGKNTQRQSYAWNNLSQQLYKTGRITYQYDDRGNKVYELHDRFDTIGNTFTSTHAYQYNYQPQTVTSIEEPVPIENLKLFPNPVHNEPVLLRFTIANTASITINVFDNLGRMVLTQTDTYAGGYNIASLNTTSLRAGLYIVQYQNNLDHSTGNLKLLVQ